MVIASLWIGGTQLALSRWAPAALRDEITVARGVGFVIATAASLFFLLLIERRALATGHRWMLGLFDDGLEAVLVYDDALNLVEANPAACVMLGYGAAELRGRALSSIAVAPCEPIRAALLGTGDSEGESALRRKDGALLEVEFRALPEISRGLRVAVLRDVSRSRRTTEALHALSGQLLRAQEEERRRIARELHDSLSQEAAAALMSMGRARDLIATGDAAGADTQLADSIAVMESCARNLRTISYLLHPPVLDQVGLGSALREYARGFAQRSGIAVHVEIDPAIERLARAAETALFRIAQESLGNVHRHSGSSAASVRLVLAEQATVVRLEVRDQGRGLPADVETNEIAGGEICAVGVGIAGMRERMRQLGGHLQLATAEGGGVIVIANLPRERAVS